MLASLVFQDDVHIVAFLTMGNRKSPDTSKISYYLLIYPSNLDCLSFLLVFKKISIGFFLSKTL